MWLGELNLILENVGVLAHEEDLVDVDFGPLVDDVLDDVETLLLSHCSY